MRPVILALMPLGALAVVARAQVPPDVDAELLRVVYEAPAPGLQLETGESIAVWVENRVAVAAPLAAVPPVADAAPGDVVARFGGGSLFSWPRSPIVWTAPAAGRLEFVLNGIESHRLSGEARVTVVRLSSTARAAFPPPVVTLERIRGGVRASYSDRAGFGLDTATLRFTVTAADGSVISMAPWAPVGDRRVELSLPPAGIRLPAGVHRLSVTVTDRVGNDARPAEVLFDTGRSEERE